MNGQQLKNSILQMAVQGKLVPQDPNDEPASVLIQRIREEKEKLIKEKKIKKEKNPSYIFRGSDNLHYEKIGDGEPVCIEDQIPFEIPDSWEWVRFSNVVNLTSGQDMTPDKYNSLEKGIPYITGASNIENGRIIINRWTESPKALAHFGDLLITCKGTVGAIAILNIEEVHIARQLMAITPIGDVNPKYIQIFLQSYVETLISSSKSMIPGISRDDVLWIQFPVPPLEEQKRIIGKIEELLPHINEYDAKASELIGLNDSFPNQLKKSILQEAVQGKLVPQDPTDEPASVLLERIREEKARLVKDGKIKKDKNESVIFRRDNSYYEKSNGVERCIDGEIPFEIPDSWKWVRLNKIVTLLGDGIHGTPLYDPKGNNYFINGTNIKNDRIIITDNTKLVSDEEALKHSRTLCDNTLLVSINGTLGNVAYYKGENIVLGKSVCYFNLLHVYKYYIGLFLKSFYVQEYLKKSATGSTIKNVPLSAMRSMLVPIPPIGEQKRIVAKIEQFLAMIKVL